MNMYTERDTGYSQGQGQGHVHGQGYGYSHGQGQGNVRGHGIIKVLLIINMAP
jgi:hypothetical protein